VQALDWQALQTLVTLVWVTAGFLYQMGSPFSGLKCNCWPISPRSYRAGLPQWVMGGCQSKKLDNKTEEQ